MRDLMVELKMLRPHSMVGHLGGPGRARKDAGLENASCLVDHLQQAEAVGRGNERVCQTDLAHPAVGVL